MPCHRACVEDSSLAHLTQTSLQYTNTKRISCSTHPPQCLRPYAIASPSSNLSWLCSLLSSAIAAVYCVPPVLTYYRAPDPTDDDINTKPKHQQAVARDTRSQSTRKIHKNTHTHRRILKNKTQYRRPLAPHRTIKHNAHYKHAKSMISIQRSSKTLKLCHATA